MLPSWNFCIQFQEIFCFNLTSNEPNDLFCTLVRNTTIFRQKCKNMIFQLTQFRKKNPNRTFSEFNSLLQFSIYRHDQSTDPKVITDAQCSVSNTGNVLCVPGIHFDTLCVPNLKKYPYDTQICTIRFGSWVYKGEELKLKTVSLHFTVLI